MKKLSVLISITVMIFIFQLIFCPVISSAGWLSDVITQGRQFSENTTTMIDNEKLHNTSNQIFGALFTVGVVITVGIGGVLGIKFMLASAEEKAEIKQALVPYIIGCIVIYGAFGIWRLIVLIGNQIG